MQLEKNKKAFTLVEILISISIIVVLSFVAFSSYDSYQNSANSSKTRADL
jgi:prepilin-type N-terminal cleavage/methylation domain-containing protein